MGRLPALPGFQPRGGGRHRRGAYRRGGRRVVPIFFNAQSDKAEERPNVDNCFPCQATGSVPCRFCENGSGTITVTLGDGTTEETECLNCEGRGAMTCPTCSGSGLQPRYLDRRVYADND